MKSPCEVRNGQLYFEDCKAEDLAQEYGTPLYLMSENTILSRINEIKEKEICARQNMAKPGLPFLKS